MRYLPDIQEDGRNSFIERQFLFTIVNTCDQHYFRDALAELEQRRGEAFRQQTDETCVEIDQTLLKLIEQLQTKMSPHKAIQSKRTMFSLIVNSKKRKRSVSRKQVEPLSAKIIPRVGEANG